MVFLREVCSAGGVPGGARLGVYVGGLGSAAAGLCHVWAVRAVLLQWACQLWELRVPLLPAGKVDGVAPPAVGNGEFNVL